MKINKYKLKATKEKSSGKWRDAANTALHSTEYVFTGNEMFGAASQSFLPSAACIYLHLTESAVHRL